jgi:hypothetical protein
MYGSKNIIRSLLSLSPLSIARKGRKLFLNNKNENRKEKQIISDPPH